jgi:conjugative transposon TraM protein
MRQKTNAFPVYSKLSKGSSTLLTSDTEGKGAVVPNGFYSLNEQSAEGQRQNAVEAVVHETETLVDGSIVKLRLVNDIYVNGNLIPKGNFLFGQASLGGERLTIEINSIRYNNSIFPVQLEVYDLDGLAGIHVPGAITRDVAKQSADNSLQSLELTSLNPSLAAQATSAGVNTARSLLSRRVKLVKVTVKANYKVLLWNKGGNQ